MEHKDKSDECLLCARNTSIIVLSNAIFMLAIGAIGLWAYSSSISLNNDIEQNRIERLNQIDDIKSVIQENRDDRIKQIEELKKSIDSFHKDQKECR
jgi:hypothetical protein